MKRQPNRERDVICQICGVQFKTRHSQGKYCSPECQRQGERNSWNKYNRKNKEKRNRSHREDYQKNKEKIALRIKKYSQTPRGKEVSKISDKRQRKKYPEKYQARQEVLKAMRKGILIPKPCEVCGLVKVEAHHEDYSKPLNVKWLCKKHHTEAHQLINLT